MSIRKLPACLASIQDIVTNKDAARLKWPDMSKTILCDLFTASAVNTVYNACSEENKVKLEGMIAESHEKFVRVVAFCFKHVR